MAGHGSASKNSLTFKASPKAAFPSHHIGHLKESETTRTTKSPLTEQGFSVNNAVESNQGIEKGSDFVGRANTPGSHYVDNDNFSRVVDVIPRGATTTGGNYGGGPGGGSNGNEGFVDTTQPMSPRDKVAGSVAGFLVGNVLILVACCLLWRNESWAVKRRRILNHARDSVIEIVDVTAEPPSDHIDQLVHASGWTTTDTSITDPHFGITRENVISLTRCVEIYQWVEIVTTDYHKLQNGDTEVRELISYRKRWVENPIVTPFRYPYGHENVGELPVTGATLGLRNIRLGAYTIDHELIDQTDFGPTERVILEDIPNLPQGAYVSWNWIVWPMSARNLDVHSRLEAEVEERFVQVDGKEETVFVVKSTGDSYEAKSRAIAMASKHLFGSSKEPEIGDVRIYYKETPCRFVSILGQLKASNVIASWQSRRAKGHQLGMLRLAKANAQEMIEDAQQLSSLRTWAMRAGGFLLNFLGFSAVTSVVSNVLDILLNWIPLLGPISTTLIGIGLSVTNGILATTLTVVVVSTAWIAYRPFVSIAMLAGALVSSVFILRGQPAKT